MATDIWKATVTSVSGNWSDATKWTPSAPLSGDQIIIGNTTQKNPFTVTEDVTLTIGSLTMAGKHAGNQTTTLLLTQPAVLTVNGPISLDLDAIIAGSGTLVANGAITGTGTILASNGLIDITGTGSIANGVVLDFINTGTLASTLKLDLSGGVTSAANIKMSNAAQTLEVGANTSLTILAAETVANGTLRMSGGTVTDTLGITVGGQGTPGTIIGFGTIAANLIGGGAKATTDTVTASGGMLDLIGSFSAGAATFLAKIDSTSASTLKFDGNAIVGQPITINSAFQTLEIGALGTLTMTGLDIVTNGTIKMDGGMLADTAGIVIDTAATLTGFGLVAAGTTLSGDGIIKASGGMLELASDLTASTTLFDVDNVAGSVLKVDGAVASVATLSFLGATGALELADVTAGVLQGFSGKIAGLNVGASATIPTNAINIQAVVSKAVLAGSTLTIFNGSTIVAALALSATPVQGAYAVFRANATLGGYDVFLSNEPPVAPSAPALAAGSDSGTKGDRITNIATPVFTGTGVTGDTVTLFDGTTAVGSATVDVNGNWSIATAALPDGLNVITARQSDLLGNLSAPSVSVTITVDTLAPGVTVALASDTGASPIDHITRN
ncbi:MAG TPA: Ig-like domain-containing protein [Rhodopila sp.]